MTYVVTTVTNAYQNLTTLSGSGVEVDNAVVVAASTPYASTGSGCVGTALVETFYIQDASGGPGVAVYRGCKDTGATPNVGDVVTVKGRLAPFDSSLQISSSTKYNIPESITVVSAGTGHATSGAEVPAGMPEQITGTAQAGYNHDAGSNAHPEKLGVVLHFPSVSVVTMKPPGFVSTSADGGTKPEGFEITGGIWVDDSIIYFDCIRPLDGGVLALPNGITGAWDRYQDYYGGTSTNPSPTRPVLVPLRCSDLQ